MITQKHTHTYVKCDKITKALLIQLQIIWALLRFSLCFTIVNEVKEFIRHEGLSTPNSMHMDLTWTKLTWTDDAVP